MRQTRVARRSRAASVSEEYYRSVLVSHVVLLSYSYCQYSILCCPIFFIRTLIQCVQFCPRIRTDEAGLLNTVFFLELLHGEIGLVVESAGYFPEIQTLKRERCLQGSYVFRIRRTDLQITIPFITEVRVSLRDGRVGSAFNCIQRARSLT